LGELVGEATGGTNGNANSIILPGGYEVEWTGLLVLKHDSSRHHGLGIRPTVPVNRTRDGVAAGRDELLERAREILGG
jgi:C-terminal processing protease CtpA/Prc